MTRRWKKHRPVAFAHCDSRHGLRDDAGAGRNVTDRRGMTFIRISSAARLSRHLAGIKFIESSNVKVLRPFFTSARSGEMAASP